MEMTREEAIKVLNMVESHGLADLAKRMAIKALEHPEQNVIAVVPCGDVISRQAVLDAIDDIDKTACMNEYHAIVKAIEDLPSVTPKQRTGHWVYTDYHTWCCSECGGNPHRGTGFVPNKDGMKMQWKYCNLCGAKMGDPEA